MVQSRGERHAGRKTNIQHVFGQVDRQAEILRSICKQTGRQIGRQVLKQADSRTGRHAATDMDRETCR